MPAPSEAVQMMLWPQACPTTGSASYSAQMAMCSGPSPTLATNAVGMSYTPRSTSKPAASSAVCQPRGGLRLLVAELGIGVDAMRQLDEAGMRSLERGSRARRGLIRYRSRRRVYVRAATPSGSAQKPEFDPLPFDELPPTLAVALRCGDVARGVTRTGEVDGCELHRGLRASRELRHHGAGRRGRHGIGRGARSPCSSRATRPGSRRRWDGARAWARGRP